MREMAKTKRKIIRIRIEFESGDSVEIDRYQLDRLKELTEAMNLINYAKDTYAELQRIFEREVRRT